MKDLRIVFDQWVGANIISNVSKGSTYKKNKTQTYFSSCFSLVSIFFIKYIITHCYPSNKIKIKDLFESLWTCVSIGWCFLDNRE